MSQKGLKKRPVTTEDLVSKPITVLELHFNHKIHLGDITFLKLLYQRVYFLWGCGWWVATLSLRKMTLNEGSRGLSIRCRIYIVDMSIDGFSDETWKHKTEHKTFEEIDVKGVDITLGRFV